jgi:hypothetical protein
MRHRPGSKDRAAEPTDWITGQFERKLQRDSDDPGTTVVNATQNGLAGYGQFLAALGMVWFGAQAPGFEIALIALPLYLVLLTIPSDASLGARANRFLLPFLIWSVIYGLVHVALTGKNQTPTLGWWEWHMLLSGTWIHLWVLPFAFVTALLSPWLQHPLASLGLAILAATLMALHGSPEAIPFGQWTFGTIPVLVGIAYFSWGWRLAVVTLLASSLILLLGSLSPDHATILAGSALGLFFVSNHLPRTAVSDWCARVSLWIYLVYPLVVIVGHSLRITYIELGLFSLVGSVIAAQIIEIAVQASQDGQPES